MINQKIQEGLSPRSIEYIHTTLSKALNAAVDADLARKPGLLSIPRIRLIYRGIKK
jgi:hypothetical protein